MVRYQLNNPPTIAENVDGEVIVINLDDGRYHSLRGDAAFVWDRLTSGVPVESVLSLCSDGEAAGRGALEDFIARLCAMDLLRPAPGQSPDGSVEAADGTWNAGGLVIETFSDMQDLLGLDPIHEVEVEAGWPVKKTG